MEKFTHSVIGNAVNIQQEKGEQNADQFVKGVQAEVKEKTDELTAEYGDAAKDVVGPILQESESYADARKGLRDFVVKDLSSEGAAGLCDKSTDEVFLGEKQFEVGADPLEQKKNAEYLQKVAVHERTHRDEQAATFDQNSITIKGGETIEAIDLYEGHAITVAGQTPSELTAEYNEHLRKYALVSSMAGQETVNAALKSGNLSEIENAIAA